MDAAATAAGCCGCSTAMLITAFMICTASLTPNEYGMLQNTISGTVATTPVYQGGLHYVGPFQRFLIYPSTQQTIEFSRGDDAQAPPVITRTGADPSDPDSGGQPISLSCAFQYEFDGPAIGKIYKEYGGLTQARLRYQLLTGNMISNTAQQFTPQDFWTDREKVSRRMKEAVNATLVKFGHARVTFFELLRIDFAGSFENSITSVQVAEQQKVVNEYHQRVREIEQSIAVMQAETTAKKTSINATAHATAAERIAKARKDAFHLKQTAKAEAYSELQSRLGLGEEQLLSYLKIKALQSQNTGSKVVVGMDALGETGNAEVDAEPRRLSSSATEYLPERDEEGEVVTIPEL